MLQTAAPAAPSTTADELLAEATWRRTRAMTKVDWASSPDMQRKVRELCGGARPAPAATPTLTLSRFEAGNRVVVVGRRTTLTAKVA